MDDLKRRSLLTAKWIELAAMYRQGADQTGDEIEYECFERLADLCEREYERSKYDG